MASPTQRDAETPKRLAWYLPGRRAVVHFGWRAAPREMFVYTDSDWAGCVQTHSSTCEGAVLRGRHVIRT